MSIDRLKEIEKIADKLGIGQNKIVECVSCNNKIQFKNAILLTNKQNVSYLCSTCNDKLTKGELNKNSQDEILKQINELKKQKTTIPVPLKPYEFWKPYKVMPNEFNEVKGTTWKFGKYESEYNLYQTLDNSLLKFEPIK